MREYTSNRRQISNVQVIRGGGFITYFKLYISLWKQFIPYFKMSTWYDNVGAVIVMLAKTPWWLMIKPFGCLIATNTHFKGNIDFITFSNDQYSVQKWDVIRRKRWEFCGIPFWWWRRSANVTEIDDILEN